MKYHSPMNDFFFSQPIFSKRGKDNFLETDVSEIIYKYNKCYTCNNLLDSTEFEEEDPNDRQE